MASHLQRVARVCAVELLNAGASKKGKWSPTERLQFTKAFNALQRLSGKAYLWSAKQNRVVRRRAGR